MTNYYVRIGGSDAAAGTSAGAAWRTVAKALGASGIASGDTLYIGGGLYREGVTVAMTSPTGTTNIIGDVTGQFTGDPGEVIITQYLNGWHNSPSGSLHAIGLAGRDYFHFQNLNLIGGGVGSAIDAAVATSTNITLTNCLCQTFGTIPINVLAGFGIALNWTINNSYIASMGNANAIVFTQTTGVSVDWDLNVAINDSVILSPLAGIQITNSGTSANEGNGIDVNRCTIFAATGFLATGTRNSLTYPSVVTDSLIFAGSGMSAGEVGAITDGGGNVTTGSLTNVTAAGTTRTATHDFPAPPISFGHEWMFGMQPRRAFSPLVGDALSRGHIGSATTDIEGRARPEGTGRFITSGTATAGAATTITDSGATWKTNEHTGRRVRITGGTGSGQVKHIASNTATVLTIGTLSGDWTTNPASGSTYIIYDGPPVETGNATSGSATTLTDTGAAWSTDQWAGYTLEITGGTGSGQTKTVVSNTSQALTVSTWGVTPDTTSDYALYWPGSSLTGTGKTPGAFEFHDSALKETTTTDAGSVGIVINGPGSHEFQIPIDNAATVITVKARYDADHGTTNKPQAIIVANPEIGVTTETVTMTSGAGSWDTLTFASQTPSAKGVVTVRLVSRSDTPYGRAYFDTFTVT